MDCPNHNLDHTDHTCYNEKGEFYRGTGARTVNGSTCLYWSQQIFLKTADYPELVGHNYCRNPGGLERSPWCYVQDFHKQYCDVPKCCKCCRVLLSSTFPNHVLP